MTPEEDAPRPDIEMVAASLRADANDLDTYTGVLLNNLGDAFPTDMVEVDRARSIADRVAGRPGEVSAVRINFDDTSLQLQRGKGGKPQGLVVTRVGGVTISRKEVPLAEWSRQLADRLIISAAHSREAAASLERLLRL